jgi:hypothetical protein
MAIWHRYWRQSSGWGGWTKIDSFIISDPEAASSGPNGAPQVFGRGVDRRLYRFVHNGSKWTRATWGLT